MKIFIPRVHSATTGRELKRLVEGVLEKKFHLPFTRRPYVLTSDILKIKDRNGVVDYHGLVSVYPDEAGKWLISRFKNQRLHNKLLYAREYIERDRNASTAFDQGENRRRPNLEVSKVETKKMDIEAVDTFHREHSA